MGLIVNPERWKAKHQSRGIDSIRSNRSRRLWTGDSPPRPDPLEPALQKLLALLRALLARLLGLAEEIGQIVVAIALGVLDVGLEPQRIGEALLGEPDDVVVLVLRAGDVAGLSCCCLHRCISSSVVG